MQELAYQRIHYALPRGQQQCPVASRTRMIDFNSLVNLSGEMRAEDATIEHQIDRRARRDCGARLQQFDGLEEKMRDAISRLTRTRPALKLQPVLDERGVHVEIHNGQAGRPLGSAALSGTAQKKSSRDGAASSVGDQPATIACHRNHAIYLATIAFVELESVRSTHIRHQAELCCPIT